MSEFHVGITGTRYSATDLQIEALTNILKGVKVLHSRSDLVFHHGDCQGVDAAGHDIATRLGYRTHIHPPEKNDVRAFKVGDVVEPVKGYFARNRDIVNSSGLMIGVPIHELTNQGGTWYTINFADKKRVQLLIVRKDGSIEPRNSVMSMFNSPLTLHSK